MAYFKTISFVVSAFVLVGCTQSNAEPQNAAINAQASEPLETQTVMFAGGCFWCVESDFDKVDGVVATLSGYSGGHVDNPTYKQVSYEDTGHFEVVQIEYKPDVVSFDELLAYYWRHVDPTDAGGQFCDRGDSYKTAVFVIDDVERETAMKSKAEIDESGVLADPVVTPILSAKTFWPAEDYHQDYYKKNPLRYKYYRTSCGRDRRVKKVWAKELSKK